MTLPPDNADNGRHDSLSPETIHEFSASLTVISAQAQMVRRWLRRNNVAEADVPVARLETIGSMVERLCQQLSDLDKPPPRDDPGTPSNGRSEP